MIRYIGQELPKGCRIALITNDAIGNYVVITPLIQMLREQHSPSVLHYFGGSRTEELWVWDPLIDWGYSLHGSDPNESVFRYQVENTDDEACQIPYDLVINAEDACWAKCFAALISSPDTLVCGPALGSTGRKDLPFGEDERGRLWEDKRWISAELPQRYPFLSSGFIGEVLARLCYLDGPLPAYRVARHDAADVPDVLIATTASLQEKLWPFQKWKAALEWMRDRGLSVGLLGAAPQAQNFYWTGGDAEANLLSQGLVEDLRGSMTLPQVVGALAKAKAVLSLDNGILHLSAATDTPTVGLFRHGIHRLWAPPADNVVVLTPGEGRAVAEIPVETVTEALERAL